MAYGPPVGVDDEEVGVHTLLIVGHVEEDVLYSGIYASYALKGAIE